MTRRSRSSSAVVVVALLAALIAAYGPGKKLINPNTNRQSVQSPLQKQGEKPLGSWEVYFSPDGGATDAVVNALQNAQDTVLVQAYSFTSAPIASALRDAHRRGVRVRVVLDKSNETQKYSAADFIFRAGITTWIDSEHAIAHNKIMIIDSATVITGSFNFTKAAEERNAENLLIIRDKALAERYTQNWKLHQEHSEAYQGKQP
jgi:phosphatidylserine/phosphatidylglycerophosphate/cardiolipin synthase-like enzyme